MKYFDWNEQKNEKLKQERDIGFEDIITAINEGYILDIVPHPNSKKYPNQNIFVVEICDYAYLIPFVEDEEKVYSFLPRSSATSVHTPNDISYSVW